MDTSFFGIGLPELIFIAIIALIVLGPERLPSTLREIAKMWGYVRNLTNELTSQFGDELKALDDINPQKIMREMVNSAEEEARKVMNSANSVAATKVTTTVTTTATVSSVVTPTESTSTVDSMTTEVKSASSALETNADASDALPVIVENRILPPIENETPENKATLPTVDESVNENQSAHSNDRTDQLEEAG